MSQTVTTTETTTFEYDAVGRVLKQLVVTVQVIEPVADADAGSTR